MHKIMVGFAACLGLAACVTTYQQPRPVAYAPPAYAVPSAPPPSADYAPPGTLGLNKTTGGALIGAGAGGLIGSKFGHGEGKGVATVLGVIAGGLIGSQIGASLDRADQAALHQTTVSALETAPPGQSLPWHNPDTGNYG